MKTKTPRKGSIWHFRPNPFDRVICPVDVAFNALVRVIQPYGCPKNGTMGMCYVEDFDSHDFIGLVCINSLVK
jgi:hypothetical protein